MTVALAPDSISLFPGAESDSHGWAEPGDITSPPLWSGLGSVQLDPGITRVRASDDGGAGPFDPASTSQGRVFLPDDAPAADGLVLVAREVAYVLSQVRLIVDPTGGPLSCIVASISQVDQWPQ